MVDDSHATGYLGKHGRGSFEHFGVKPDIVTGTLGKALGGAMGGFTSSGKGLIEVLRQRSRPYLFSNSVAPAVVGASLEVLKMLSESTEKRDRLMANAKRFREEIVMAGFEIKPGITPIVPVMIYDDRTANEFAMALMEEGIYVTGFYYPIVPKGQARIRVQISAAHTDEHLERAVKAFSKLGKKFGVI
jgi:glycine C-acetyltransferase